MEWKGDFDSSAAYGAGDMVAFEGSTYIAVEAVPNGAAAPPAAPWDLMVMGGYGHSRLREAIFSGVSRSVLEAPSVPVLVSH